MNGLMRVASFLICILGVVGCAAAAPSTNIPATDGTSEPNVGSQTELPVTPPREISPDASREPTLLPTPTITLTITLMPTSTASLTPEAPVGDLPDLLVTQAGSVMQNYTGGCVPEYAPTVLRVCVRNDGSAPAGAFLVRLSDQNWQVTGLGVGEQTCHDFEPSTGTIIVDAENVIEEFSEANNSFIAQPMTLTPPALCSPTP